MQKLFDLSCAVLGVAVVVMLVVLLARITYSLLQTF